MNGPFSRAKYDIHKKIGFILLQNKHHISSFGFGVSILILKLIQFLT